MRVSIITLIFFLMIGLPVLAMEKMSQDELRKITAQLASTAGHAADGAAPAGDISDYGGTLYGGYTHAVDIQPVTTEALGIAQTAAEPVSTVINIGSDVNGFKSGVSFGAF